MLRHCRRVGDDACSVCLLGARVKGERDELPSHRITSGVRRVRSAGGRTIAASRGSPGGVRCRSLRSVVAKRGGGHRVVRPESLDVETVARPPDEAMTVWNPFLARTRFTVSYGGPSERALASQLTAPVSAAGDRHSAEVSRCLVPAVAGSSCVGENPSLPQCDPAPPSSPPARSLPGLAAALPLDAEGLRSAYGLHKRLRQH